MKTLDLTNENLLKTYKDAVDKNYIVSITDTKGKIQYVNEEFSKTSGYSKEEVIGKSHSIVRHPDMPTTLFAELWKTILNGKIWRGVIKNRGKNGRYYYVSTTISPIIQENEILGFLSIRYDITELMETKEHILLHSTDSLTELPTRQKLVDSLSLFDGEAMLVFIDINHFSDMNNIYGEGVGDIVLKETADILKRFVSDEGATLYKMSADVFAILITEQTLYEKYLFIAKNSILMNEEEILVSKKDGISLAVSFTVGVAYGKVNLIRKAWMALKKAQKESKNIEIYSSDFNIEDKQKENMEQLKVFKHALQEDQIVPFFQPIVNAKTREIKKYEAIARVIDRDGSIVSPAKFLDVARESKLHDYFTRQMIQKIFKIASKNREITFSINLTYNDISNIETINYVQNRLKTLGGENIVFELLESEEVVDYNIIVDFIKTVKTYGCKISIDDFGSGYSNFVHLAKLDIDFIKLDGSIISNITHDKDSELIVKIIKDFAREKGIATIAEFVSSKEILEKLNEYDIDYFQGFYLGEPRLAKGYNLNT